MKSTESSRVAAIRRCVDDALGFQVTDLRYQVIYEAVGQSLLVQRPDAFAWLYFSCQKRNISIEHLLQDPRIQSQFQKTECQLCREKQLKICLVSCVLCKQTHCGTIRSFVIDVYTYFSSEIHASKCLQQIERRGKSSLRRRAHSLNRTKHGD
jgi:hypothetical protein